jgi:hypothetical protein
MSAIRTPPAVTQRTPVATASSVQSTLAPLQPYVKGLDLNRSYLGEPSGMSIADAWKHKDAGALAAWSQPAAMGPVLAFVTSLNRGDGGDYLGRAIAQNMDASIWLRLLEREGIVDTPTKEWRTAIEVATLSLDVGADGAGRTGFMFILSGVDGYPSKSPTPPVKMPQGIQARAGMLVGGSGTGLFVDKIFENANVAKDFAKRLTNEQDHGQSAKSLSVKAKDPAHTAKEIALVESGTLVQSRADRDAFAEALLVTKLSDRSRGAVFKAYLAAGGGDAGLDAVMGHTDFKRVVEGSFEAKRAVRAD